MDVSELAEHTADFRRHCRARGLAPRTISDYVAKLHNFVVWAQNESGETIVSTGLIKDFMGQLLERKVETEKCGHTKGTNRIVSRKYALNHYVVLQQFFKWAVEDHLCNKNIWSGMQRPKPDKKPVDIVKPDAIAAVLQTTKVYPAHPAGNVRGTKLVRLRDEAILRLFIDTGVRVGDLLSMTVDTLDLTDNIATVVGKGNKVRQVPFGERTAIALSRYLREREARGTSIPDLWVGRYLTPLKDAAVREMVERRCIQAGVPHIYPHQFRHTAAHNWLSSGGSETGLAQIMGWETGSQMLKVYGDSAASERAIAESRRLDLGGGYR